MEFEQLNLDSAIYDLPKQVTYRTLDSDGKIYCKIDWLTVIFTDCSISHVLNWLHLSDAIEDFCSSRYEQCRGYDVLFRFVYNSVSIESSAFGFYGCADDISIFDVIVPKIRLELSGSALTFLRSTGITDDYLRFERPELPQGGTYHFSRCDWAFDFVNYKPGFVDALISHINRHKLPSERVPLASTKGAVSCKIVTGGQKTVYLGSPQSDKMLRCYDKRLQYIDLSTGLFKKENEYNNPDSWYRIEWQTRNKVAHAMVVDPLIEFKHVLKLIFESYAFADGTVKRDREPVDFWQQLFPWSDVEKRIIQNAKYVEYVSAEERVIKSFESVMIRSFIFWYTLLGREECERRINHYLRQLELPDIVNHRRFLSFLNKLNEFDLTLPYDSNSRKGLWINHGRLDFKF